MNKDQNQAGWRVVPDFFQACWPCWLRSVPFQCCRPALQRQQSPHPAEQATWATCQHVGARRLGVPAFAHIRQSGKQRHAAVLPKPDVGQVGQVALRASCTESSGQNTGRGKRALASPFLRQRTTSTPQQTRSSFHFCSPQTSGGSRGEFT